MKIKVTFFDELMSKKCGIEMTDTAEFNSIFEAIRFFQGPGSHLEIIEVEARVMK